MHSDAGIVLDDIERLDGGTHRLEDGGELGVQAAYGAFDHIAHGRQDADRTSQIVHLWTIARTANRSSVSGDQEHAQCAAIADIQRPADDQLVRGDGEVDREGRSALHHAALDGNLVAVRDLLRRGSAVNAADRAGFTPLHFAAQNQHAGLVPVLADAGAEVDARDAWGDTPLFRAVFHSNGDGDTIKALLAVGADPDAANLTGRSPRSLAATIANYDVAKFLT